MALQPLPQQPFRPVRLQAGDEVPAGPGAPRGRGGRPRRGHGVAEGDEERRRGRAGDQVSVTSLMELFKSMYQRTLGDIW